MRRTTPCLSDCRVLCPYKNGFLNFVLNGEEFQGRSGLIFRCAAFLTLLLQPLLRDENASFNFKNMSLFNRLFSRNEDLKECPRCLGKGQVDWDDIKRLNQNLKWIPGKCAYCNGTGKVDKRIESNVSVDASYLVIGLEEEERKRIINGHPDAIERGKQFEDAVDNFIDQIAYLHFEGGLTPLQIAKFFLIGKNDSDEYEKEERELIDYVERVIEKQGKT